MGNTNNSGNIGDKQTVTTTTHKRQKRFDPDPNYLRPSDDPNDWNNSSSLLGLLPPEITLEIFSLLQAKELAVLSRSCKKAREIAYDYDKFWEAYMDMGLKRYEVTDDLALEVISKFAPVKSNWNFAICEQIHNETLIHLNKYCSTMALLNIASCRNITDEGIMHFTDKFATLTELNLAHTRISAEGLKHIVQYAPRLHKLCLKSMSLSDISMLEGLHNLTELDLSNPRFTSYDAIRLPIIPSLNTLIIPKFPVAPANLTLEANIIKSIQSMPNLTKLDLSETSLNIIRSIDSLRVKSLTIKPAYDWRLCDIQKTLLAIGNSLTYLDMSGGQDSRPWAEMILYAVENSPNLQTLKINNCFNLTKKVPKLFDLIYEHMNLTYLEGYGYVFDVSLDQQLVMRLRQKKRGLKIISDGVL